MALEDFEKTLADEKRSKDQRRPRHRHEDTRHRRDKHGHQAENRGHSHRHKRRKHSRDGSEREYRHTHDKNPRSLEGSQAEAESKSGDLASLDLISDRNDSISHVEIKRDSWMKEPSALDFDYTQKGVKKSPQKVTSRSSKADFELKIHENELNKHHLQDLADGRQFHETLLEEPTQHNIDYVFGDAGALWRMTKLKGVYRRAKEEGRDVDDVAEEQYGDLQSFDDAREEQTELERRDTYGEGYIGKEKPRGELFTERKIQQGIRRHLPPDDTPLDVHNSPKIIESQLISQKTTPVDQSALNRLRAQMLKAQVKGGPEAARKTAEYNDALSGLAHQKQADVRVLSTMENRMLAGGRRGEVKTIDNKRGRERGLVEDNEDMTIEDMVREERRTRGQAGGDGRRFAERIAKDGKFDNDLEYMDENATKLAKRVQKSEINLRNTAITDFQKMNRILDTCPLCHHEDTNTPPVAPVVSLATRVYLTLPTEPEISDGGASIIPLQHRSNLLECDDDEWEEIRNFMKSLTRMYHDQGRDVIFYENAAAPQRKKHAGMEVVPLPYSLGETAPAFFKEAILSADEEWTQHKKIIDTMAKAKSGLGKSAFRRTLVKEMPYFHVWFGLDGGLGHIVEDSNRWPKGDLFAREIIGGMLDQGPDVIKRQGRWTRNGDPRITDFQKRWRKFDWTRVLTDG